MSSVLSLKSFKTDFGLPLATTGFASKTNAHISQNVVSLLTAGVMESSRYKDWGRRHEGPIWIMTETKEKKKRKQPNVVSSLNTDKLH